LWLYEEGSQESAMIACLALLLACQLAGEVIVRMTHLPIPGPVIGMGLLFIGLVIRGGAPPALEDTANRLLSHLSLLFVPAGVGIMLHLELILDNWLSIGVALLISTALTIAVTGWLMQRLATGGK
jgi:holin-like protein